MRWLTVPVLLLLWSGTALSVPKVPAKVLTNAGGRAVIEVQLEKDKPAAWRPAFAPEDCFVDELRPLQPNTIRLIIEPSKGGVYRIILWDGPKLEDSVELVIDATGPKPPSPTPDPTPTPTPDSVPIAAKGLRVLIVYESGDLPKLPTTQQSIIFGTKLRTYLNDKCVVGEDGKTKEFRIWDANVDAGSDSKLWGDAFKRKRDSIPWIIVSNGVTGYEGPLPANTDDTIALIQKYAK